MNLFVPQDTGIRAARTGRSFRHLLLAWRDPGSASPVCEMTSRIIKAAYRKSCVPQGNQFVCKLLDHRSQSPRIHMRPTRWQRCALVRHDCPPWVGVEAPKENPKLCRALRLVSDGEIPGLQ